MIYRITSTPVKWKDNTTSLTHTLDFPSPIKEKEHNNSLNVNWKNPNFSIGNYKFLKLYGLFDNSKKC